MISALWAGIMKVNFRLSRNLVLHGLLNKKHSGMHSNFQRFRCFKCMLRFFFNLTFDGISAILLNKMSHIVNYLVNYKKIQETFLVKKLAYLILRTFWGRSFLELFGSIGF